MAIAIKLKEYLDQEHVKYDVIDHPYSMTSMHTAQQAHISGENIAKAVVLHDDAGYVLAVVPATHKVQLGKLHKKTVFTRYHAEYPAVLKYGKMARTRMAVSYHPAGSGRL